MERRKPLQPGKPLKRTSPLKSSTRLHSRTTLKQTPLKPKRKLDAVWERARLGALARDEHRCQMFRHRPHEGKEPGPCWGPLHVHHIFPRGRGGKHGLDNLVTLCTKHHTWVHVVNRPEAKRLGLLQ